MLSVEVVTSRGGEVEACLTRAKAEDLAEVLPMSSEVSFEKCLVLIFIFDNLFVSRK